MTLRRAVATSALLSFLSVAAPPRAARAAEPALLIRGGTLLTVTDGTIDRGDLLVRDGRIAAIGRSIEAPQGAAVIDATGKFVMPGIIDTHSHMGVYPWPEVPANSDGNEMTDPVTPAMRAQDAVWTEDPAFERARQGGVTTVQIIPGSGNLIGGQGVTIKLRPGADLDRLLFRGAPRSIKMALGENPKGVYGPRQKSPSTRMGNMALFRAAFARARDDRARRAAWSARKDDDRGAPPDRDLGLEVLSDVLDGKVLVHVHSYRKDEMLRFLDIADEFGFRVASFQHALEAYKIGPELRRRDIAVATFAHSWGYKVEAWDGIPHNTALLARDGVRVSIHSDSANLVQRLYSDAALAVRFGLSEEDALKAITLHAASTLGVADRVGSLSVGKDADIAIFTRHPLDVYALVDKTLIDGRVVFDRGGSPTPASLPAPPAPRRGESAPPPADLLPEPAPVNPAGIYAIVGGRVFTMTGPPIENGVVIVDQGRIREVGAGLRLPAGATVIDARGGWVFPGLIESSTQIGIAEISQVKAMRDDDEAAEPILPQLDVMDAYNTESEIIPVTRAHGITAALVSPGDGNVVGGRAALVRLAGGSPAEVLIRPGAALAVGFGEPPKARYGGRNQSPATRMGIAAVLREALTRARDYRVKWQAYEAKKAAFEPGSKSAKGGRAVEPPSPPDRDLKMEPLLAVLEGRIPVLARAQRVDDILTAVRLADEFGLRLVIRQGAEAYKVADLLAARNIPVVVGPISTQPDSIETLGAIYDNAARLRRAGVKIAITSGDTLDARMLPYEAGLAVAYGLPWEEAVRAVTAAPAEIFGVADRVGSLRPGLEADLFVADGDPLQPITRIRHLMIGGRPVPLESRHTDLYARWRRP